MHTILKDILKLKRRILIVDDEEINRRMLSKILSSEYDVILAEDGDRALEIIRKEGGRLSLVLLDLIMPGTDGYEVIRIMEKEGILKRLPVIVLTSDGSAEVKSLRTGAADFIPKPYDLPEVILARIEKTIQIYESISAADSAGAAPEKGDEELLRLKADMEEALAEGQFVVYYQPKYSIQSDTPFLSSAEALVRWMHPEFGLISPAKFIPVLEKNGMVRQLDRFVWKESARQIKEWEKKLGFSIPVSVNVSRIDLMEPGFTDEISAIVEEAGITKDKYFMEITESAYTGDNNSIIEVVEKLRGLGFRMEMDDFGTGYSSLNMLSSLPIDVLKLDMVFIRRIHESEKDMKMVELIMNMANYLELTVVAEGVENEEQYRLLKDAGIHLIQGYYFSRPIPADEMEGLIRERIDYDNSRKA